MRRAGWLLLVLAVLALGCGPREAKVDDHAGEDEHGHEHEEEGHGEEVSLTPEAAKIAGIVVAPVRNVPMQSELNVPGVVSTTAAGRAVVTPPVPGKIMKLLATPGQTVKAGQGIAVLQSAELAEADVRVMEARRGVLAAQSEVKEAESEAALARNELRSAEANLDRQRQLVRTGAFSQPAMLQAEKELNEAKAELETAEKEEVVHLAQLERAEKLYNLELISKTELEEARLELEKDKTRQATARKQIAIAQANYDREKIISERGLMNAKEVQTAEAEVRAAKLAVERARILIQTRQEAERSARRGVTAAQASYRAQAGGLPASGGSITVTAPISGVIATRSATLGQAVDRTTELAQIANLNTVYVTANVPEKQIGQASKGATARVTVAALPNRSFRGLVQVVGTQLDPKTRTLPVQVVVENHGGALKPEMFASVSLGVGGTALVLAVPKSALVADGDQQVIFVEEPGEEGHYAARVVTVGRAQGDMVQIVEGLEAGDRVVVKGGFVLKSELVKGELKGHEH